MFMRKIAAAAIFIAVGFSGAQASVATFFGEDVNLSGDPNQAAFTNANTARSSFFSTLTGVGTETFESFSTGASSPFAVSFGAAGTATINGGSIASGNDGAGRYPVSGSQYLLTNTSNFSLDFSQPVAAFGFFGTDIGDFGGQLTLMLTDKNNVVSSLIVPHTIGTGGSTSGSNLFFGFQDTGNQYKSIVFQNNSTVDNFAFDDFSIGSASQITNGVPETSTWIMMLLGFSGLSFVAYLRRSQIAGGHMLISG